MAVIRRKNSQVKTAKTTKAPAKGRVVAKKSETTTATKKAPVKGRAKVTTVAKPSTSKKASTPERQKDPVTGFGVGTDSDVMIKEAMRGGNTRPEVIARIKDKLPDKTENGTDKPVANVFASVLKKKLDQGWKVQSSWVLVPPSEDEKGDNVTSITSTKKKTGTTPAKKRVARKKAA